MYNKKDATENAPLVDKYNAFRYDKPTYLTVSSGSAKKAPEPQPPRAHRRQNEAERSMKQTN